MLHYVYKITNLLNNKIYIGVRSHPMPYKDDYMGSSKVLNTLMKIHGDQFFKKDIIKTFQTREEAVKFENSFFTKDFIESQSTYNRSSRNGIVYNMRKDLYYDFCEEIRNEYLEGKTLGELGKKYNCDKGTISRIVDDIKRTLSESQILRFKRYEHPNKIKLEAKLLTIPSLTLKKIINEYNLGVSLNSLAKQYSIKQGYLRDLFIDLNIQLRSGSKHTFNSTINGVKFKATILDKASLIKDEYNKGTSVKIMAQLFSCHPDTIRRFINLVIKKK